LRSSQFRVSFGGVPVLVGVLGTHFRFATVLVRRLAMRRHAADAELDRQVVEIGSCRMKPSGGVPTVSSRLVGPLGAFPGLRDRGLSPRQIKRGTIGSAESPLHLLEAGPNLNGSLIRPLGTRTRLVGAAVPTDAKILGQFADGARGAADVNVFAPADSASIRVKDVADDLGGPKGPTVRS
jgi:hypothetical protein